MRILLDTNIIIHRESRIIIHPEIGQLFKWIDNLNYRKYVHPVTLLEIEKYNDPAVVATMIIKLENYNVLKTISTEHKEIKKIKDSLQLSQNTENDLSLLNELINDRVDIFITEDRGIHNFAEVLGIGSRVHSISSFLEKIIQENPSLIDYKTLSVRKEFFGKLDLNDSFFSSLIENYSEFPDWFNRKADDQAYVCKYNEELRGFLYLKVESQTEDYSNITPNFPQRKRLKIGTFKVTLPGVHLGERFLKIVFDNALAQKVDEIYVTIFAKGASSKLLINLLSDFGFVFWGEKETDNGTELVYIRPLKIGANLSFPKRTYPFISKNANVFFVSIYPDYHTELLPDSILRTESVNDFVEDMPHRNAISKLYISRAIDRDIKAGDILVFYRTGGMYEGVVTSLGIVECIKTDFQDGNDFVSFCLRERRTLFSREELIRHWDYNKYTRPFTVNFLYNYSFPKRVILKTLVEEGIINGYDKIPRGFGKLTFDDLLRILKLSNSDASIITD